MGSHPHWRRSPRPSNYHTPSPPSWSPLLTPIGTPSPSHSTRPQKQALYKHTASSTIDRSRPSNQSERPCHRSIGSMEVFASIAIATQHAEPSLSAGKRTCDASHVISRGKRARTDSSSCQRLGPTSLQPATSYGQSYETCLEEAELLLHFAHQARDTQLSQFDGPDVLRLQHTLYNLAAVLQPEEHAAGRNGPGNNQSSPVQPMGEDIQEQRKPSKDILDPSIGHSINGPIEETELSPFLSLAEAPHVPTVAGVHTESVLQKILHGTKERDRDTDTTVFYERRQASNEISGLTQTHEAGPSLMLNTPQDNREESPDYNARQHHVLEIPQPSRVDAAHEIISLDGEALPSLEHISNGRDSALEMSYDASQTHADSPKYEAQDAMPVSSPTQVNANGLNSSDAVSTSHAVCAACRFSKNSLSIDSEGNATSWINCDGCKSWFHFACAGFKNEREVRSIDKYRCKKCKPIHGATSYVRKSARAHSAIDYAGLHQGVIKTSDDRPEHHYIQPIKNGTISFLPENFPRMRPELVTSEYFEKGSGMKEPVVIPASINPRPYVSELKEPTLSDLHQSSTYCGIDDSANLEEWLNQDSEACRIPDDGQDDLDMVMPRGLTVRKVAELYGSEEKIEVIDVKSQNGEGRKWNMRRWVDYYENADENKTIRNVISLEVSQSLLGKLIRRPQIVRDLDLQDAVWPEDLLAKGEYPHVQFYCLMSVADCFTDFHIDFGGSSVFYHILKGKKTFLFIPPKEKHLKRYEEWCMSPAQNWTFLPDQTHECYRVDLSEGDTMLIPSGWIHAVWTPEDSLVIGGNFLTRLNYGMQLRIAQVEKNTGVARKFRYPHFQKLHWFTVLQYVEDDPLPSKVREQLESGSTFRRETSSSDQFNEWGENSKISPENFHARYYSQAELEGLPDLLRYVLRTVLIENGTITEGITAETRNAVRKSIPRGHGEPMEVIKTFAIWCAWKRGNEPILHWAYPNAIVEAAASDKLSLAASKKLAEEAALKAPRRQSRRMQAQKEANKTINAEADGNAAVEDLPSHEVEATEVRRPFELLQEPGTTDESFSPFKKQRIMNGSNTQRKTACDSCRRRRRACKHKGVVEPVIADGQHETAPSKKVHKEAFLNGNALQEKLSSIGGLFNSLTAKSETHQSSTPASLVPQESSLTFAAADHTLEHSPAALGAVNPALPAPQQNRIDETAPPENGSPSRPRTKACNHCRKSKRRCIHDAFGNEDPIKIAESAVPRPHARKTNRAEASFRKHTFQPGVNLHLQDSFYDDDTFSITATTVNTRIAPTANMVPEVSETGAVHDRLKSASRKESPHSKLAPDDTTTGPNETTMTAARESESHEVTRENEPFAIDPSLTSGMGIAPNMQSAYEASKTSLAFNQASSSLVSPPASAYDTPGDSSPTANETPSKSGSGSRGDSHPPQGHFQRYTPESGSARRASQSTSRGLSVEQETQRVEKRRSTSAQEADEESLRLIKELHAQDLNLRRRVKA